MGPMTTGRPMARMAETAALLVVLGVAGACLAVQQAEAFFSVRKHAGYPAPERALEELVAQKGTVPSNHFCVVGYRRSSGDDHAWVHWKEGRVLVLWEPAADVKYPASLTTSRRFLNLDRDVVDSEADVKGSTYLVTRAWVKQVADDCTRNGDQFVVNRTAPTSTRRTPPGRRARAR